MTRRRQHRNPLHAAARGFAAALAVSAGLVVLASSFESPPRWLALVGGLMPGGTIQFFTYGAFFWALDELRQRFQVIREERQAMATELLPESDHWVMSFDEVMQLRLRMIELEKTQPSLVTALIRKAATKFRASQSVPEVMEIVTSQSKINLARAESSQSIIRYLVWAIPSIGFIGTIIGISGSLGLAGEATREGGLEAITARLNVAFDTTLVALVLSLVTMYLFHRLQEAEETLHSDLEEHVTENFVNRLHPEP